ncbi:MAG: 4-vinyl reductase [Acaryochloris sp. RU_4_1]|nr:4-vinyl reductase [Acaryochloris sp. SU_5_25]NJM64965.1 4-vinyl reductase [Acaryochloris sp. RU_4_1]NJN37556.1 4-vinyl reductase [Acaryochloridaceae cyanobacterium CSU_3_4]NJR54452.1 4-vinyl reductase [Acaryochloris sp. CRU_2_0]
MVFTQAETATNASFSSTDSGHSFKQLYPHKLNHYRFEDFFRFNRSEGAIEDWHESRNILASEDFIIALIEGLEQEVGSASSVVMYNIGKAWGQQDALFFQNWFEAQFQQTLKKSRPSIALEAWWWPFTSQGWGNWEVDLENQSNGFMFINIFDSAVARTLGDVGKPVCHIYAGLFAGFFTHLVNKELSCIETQCYAMGETYCKFLLGKQDRIDAATFWQNEGATARDIETRLHAGEYLA